MDKVLTEFIHALRGADIRISTAESLDAARVVQQLGYANRNDLHDALALTLAKSQPEKLAFTQCFQRFFAGLPTFEPSDSSVNSPENNLTNNTQTTPLVAPTAPQSPPALPQSPLGQLLLSGDQGAIQAAFAQAGDAAQVSGIRMITQKGLYGRRMMMAMGLADLEQELWNAQSSDDLAQQALAEQLLQARERLRAQTRQWVERQFVLQAAAAQRELREETLMNLSLNNLHEFRRVMPLVQKLAKKLVTLHSRRRREAVRGRLDFRKTLRHSIPHDGSILTLHWKTRKIDRPRVMVLCDVSGSVSAAARFLLMFLYGMVEVIPKVRAFAFSSSLGEVSDVFDALPIEKAIAHTLDRYGMGSTDYGRALEDFMTLAGNDIDRRTTVIMLGDARNNYGDPQLALWETLFRRAGRVYWLNPEARNRWGSGDSEMLRYLPWITQASECQNLKQLERFASTLLKVSR
jgi:uncharacterized protein with von Willebrand factor type A (vWA) domain